MICYGFFLEILTKIGFTGGLLIKLGEVSPSQSKITLRTFTGQWVDVNDICNTTFTISLNQGRPIITLNPDTDFHLPHELRNGNI
jgi:hypothetical protein